MENNKQCVTVQIAWSAEADRSLPLPRYETAGSAGADVCANFADHQSIVLDAGERALIPTGLRMAIAKGYEVQLRPRSGLALKYGISMANAPGTIDSDYRGPVGAILVNMGDVPFEVSHGMRIAQMVVAPVVQAKFVLIDELDETLRGAGGFGSTGR